ncbi:hypothetical protein FLK61_25960 [Paenalkalicoccus suaedae]|uniref:Uncharacterized protein n=1 Tax=Paenalkalicoccus suaedae TaxID=2592382 RepID=A0A859FB70_9BACI|nr:hypothetical protein [Paenalkalicoccus suaedae]QKS70210.1 hypothetical protein FLK61_25960 [Paenalkalicoccus suaedae]
MNKLLIGNVFVLTGMLLLVIASNISDSTLWLITMSASVFSNILGTIFLSLFLKKTLADKKAVSNSR